MINATALNIEIIDTELNERSLIEEFAERKSLRLRYNGGDDRFNYIMASQLDFTMEVNDAADLHFEHLFTGNETRYQVVVSDQDENVLWRGHLLPEQYSEPYSHKIFYVTFTATDGLARLKNKRELFLLGENNFEGFRSNVIKILQEILIATNLNLPLYFAPGIKNDATEVDADWSKIGIDRRVFEDTKDLYKILEAILETLGMTLYCYKDAWYCIALNRYRSNENVINAYKYGTDGALIETVDLDVAATRINLADQPNITLLPPFQSVEATWNIDEPASIFPDDIIEQPYETLIAFTSPPATKYWQNNTGSGVIRYNFGRNKLNLGDGFLGLGVGNTSLTAAEYDRRTKLISDPARMALATWTALEDLGTNYGELIEPIYLRSDPDYIDINLELRAVFTYDDGSGPFPDFDPDVWGNANLCYAILQNDDIIISNLPSYENYENYLLDISFEGTDINQNAEDPARIIGRLNLKEMQLPEPGGYLQIRVYALAGVQNNIRAGRTGLQVCDIKYSNDKEIVDTVTRPIDWSTKHEIDTEHGGHVNDLSLKHFTLTAADSFPPPGIELLGVIEVQINQAPQPTLYFEVSQSDYQLLQTAVTNEDPVILYNPFREDKIVNFDYFPNAVADADEFLQSPIFREEGGKYYVRLYYSGRAAAFYLDPVAFPDNTNDVVYITEVFPDTVGSEIARSFRESWSRYSKTAENADFNVLRAQMVHDITPEPQVKLDADIYGLHDPLRMKAHVIGTYRKMVATDLTLNLDEGTTTATLVEVLHDDDIETSYNT